MSLLYPEMVSLIQEVAPALIGKKLTNCSEYPNHYLNLTFNQTNLLICLQMPFLRFHLTKYLPKSHHTAFSKLLEKHLQDFMLTQMQLLNTDRILELTFSNKNETFYIVIELFPKKPNLYVLNSEKQIILSYNPTKIRQYQIPPLQCSDHAVLNQPITSEIIEKLYQDKEKIAALRNAKMELSRKILNDLKAAKRQQAKALQNLGACSKWEEVQHQALLLQSSLYKIKKGMKEIAIPDWTLNNQEVQITLPPLVEPKIAMEKLFKKSRKLREGSVHWDPIIKKAEADILKFQELITEIEGATSLEDLKKHQKILSANKLGVGLQREVLPYRLFHSSTGLEIWVGKTAKDNDQMTFRLAKGSDWWLHVHNYPGSHVIIRVDKGKEPDQKTLSEAIQLALKYSKATDKGEIEICITQCKHLARVSKHSPGKVSVSQHRIVRATYL